MAARAALSRQSFYLPPSWNGWRAKGGVLLWDDREGAQTCPMYKHGYGPNHSELWWKSSNWGRSQGFNCCHMKQERNQGKESYEVNKFSTGLKSTLESEGESWERSPAFPHSPNPINVPSNTADSDGPCLVLLVHSA